MNRYAKPFGMAALAALLVAAGTASPASAVKEIRSAEAPRVITGAQVAGSPFAFKFAAGELKCTTSTLEGVLPKTGNTQLTVHPKLSGCTMIGFGGTVTTTGCNFVFTYKEGTIPTTGPEDTHTPGLMHIECEAGKQIEITPTFLSTSVCTIKIPPQTPSEPDADHKVEGAPTDVKVTYTVEQMDYTVEKGGEFCGKEGLHQDGFFTGSHTVKGYESKEGGKEGAQVAIWVS